MKTILTILLVDLIIIRGTNLGVINNKVAFFFFFLFFLFFCGQEMRLMFWKIIGFLGFEVFKPKPRNNQVFRNSLLVKTLYVNHAE